MCPEDCNTCQLLRAQRGDRLEVSGEKPDPGRGLWESCWQVAGNMLDLLLNVLGVLGNVPASTVTI